MKSVISASLIFIFIITASVISGVYVNNIADEMLQSLYKNEKFISNNLWEDAEEETKKLEKIWHEKRIFISTVFNHTLTDRIDMGIAKIKNAVKMQEKGVLIYECTDMRIVISSLKEQQKINAGNIF